MSQVQTSGRASNAKKRVRLGVAFQSALFFALLALLAPAISFAAVEITHVEYDLPGSDDGREWVEITNKGGESVDVSKFKFLEGGVNHKLTIATGNPVLAPGASAIIASNPATFASEHPGETRSVFKSSFSLSNSGETIALVDAAGKTEYSLSYVAAPKPAPPAPVKKTTTAASAKTSTTASVATSEARSYADPSDVAAAGAAALPPTLVWGAGLAGIIALGAAGVLWVRMQRRSANHVTRAPGDEFKIVED